MQTLDALGIEQATLAGNSFGGAVALNVAVGAPERVAALAQISAVPPDLEPSEQLQRAWEAEETLLEGGDVDGAVRAVLEAWLLPDEPLEQRELVTAMQRRAFELQLAAGDSEEVEEPLASDPGALPRLRLPVLAAYGEHDMPDFRDGAHRLAAAIPGARVAMIPARVTSRRSSGPSRFARSCSSCWRALAAAPAAHPGR